LVSSYLRSSEVCCLHVRGTRNPADRDREDYLDHEDEGRTKRHTVISQKIKPSSILLQGMTDTPKMTWQATTPGKRPKEISLTDLGRRDTEDFEGKGN